MRRCLASSSSPFAFSAWPPLALGSGLFGIGGYDDGVYFGSALGLVNGLMLYRDFVMLHPPGVTLALAPPPLCRT